MIRVHTAPGAREVCDQLSTAGEFNMVAINTLSYYIRNRLRKPITNLIGRWDQPKSNLEMATPKQIR